MRIGAGGGGGCGMTPHTIGVLAFILFFIVPYFFVLAAQIVSNRKKINAIKHREKLIEFSEVLK
jgi:hypothetical protein